MSLNKKRMVREIGRRTRLNNRDVERVIETLVEVWTEELINGGRIELEHFVVIETQLVTRSSKNPFLRRKFRQIKLRTSKRLRERLNEQT
ncbi:MAG: hypothetical protein BroJett007_10640 [Chloroflexota bacterium]|nr:MAG: hypothetical protein BroJett007_10640 [Chloroflexota bacterium]